MWKFREGKNRTVRDRATHLVRANFDGIQVQQRFLCHRRVQVVQRTDQVAERVRQRRENRLVVADRFLFQQAGQHRHLLHGGEAAFPVVRAEVRLDQPPKNVCSRRQRQTVQQQRYGHRGDVGQVSLQ